MTENTAHTNNPSQPSFYGCRSLIKVFPIPTHTRFETETVFRLKTSQLHWSLGQKIGYVYDMRRWDRNLKTALENYGLQGHWRWARNEPQSHLRLCTHVEQRANYIL